MKIIKSLVVSCLFFSTFLAFNSYANDSKNKNTIVIDGSTTVGPIAKAFAEHMKKQMPKVKITISESGSGNGVKSLINGTCDVATMSRFMKTEEFKAAVNKSILPISVPVAYDALAMVVHPSNPIKNLSVEQIKGIYSGKIQKWSGVGGPDVAIVKISRDTNSGTYEAFENLVMNKEKIAANAEYVGSNGAVKTRVQKTPAAIGFVGLGFLDKSLKVVSVDGITPNKKTVTSGSYPLARSLYLFTNGTPKIGSPLSVYVNFYLTRKGQQIIDSLGFVPYTEY